jgi:hypothetical protein
VLLVSKIPKLIFSRCYQKLFGLLFPRMDFGAPDTKLPVPSSILGFKKPNKSFVKF